MIPPIVKVQTSDETMPEELVALPELRDHGKNMPIVPTLNGAMVHGPALRSSTALTLPTVAGSAFEIVLPSHTGARKPLNGGTYAAPQALELLNSWFFIAEINGASPIAQIEDDGSLSYMATKDFSIRIRNIFVTVTDAKGNSKTIGAEKFWLEHPKRHQRKIVFKPKDARGMATPGEYNLWRGFAVETRRGWRKQRRLLRHIHEIICGSEPVKFKYLMKWLAWAVQHPDMPPGTVVILKSRIEGTGKSTLSYVMRDIFGKHARIVDNKDQLLGRFNSNLETVCFCSAEEILWAGDLRSADAIKSLITGDTLTIELKHGSCWSVPNRLHILMTTNHDHAVHAGVGDRRYFVLDVSPKKANNKQWFDPLYHDLVNGGREEFLGFLLNINLDGWHPRMMPKTAEAVEQQRMSADGVAQWAQSCIDADAVTGAPMGITHDLGSVVTSEALRAAYAGYCNQHKIHQVGESAFGRALTAMFGEPARVKVGKKRPRAYRMVDADTWQTRLDAWLGVNKKP